MVTLGIQTLLSFAEQSATEDTKCHPVLSFLNYAAWNPEHVESVLWYSIKLNGIVLVTFNHSFNIVGNVNRNGLWDFVFIPLFIITNKFIVNSKWNSENTIITVHTNQHGNMRIGLLFYYSTRKLEVKVK